MYEYDVFVSYSHRGNVLEWVHNHFEPCMRRCLADLMPRQPLLFLDKRIEIGADWPTELAEAHHRSRIVLAVLSPPYFQSPWCTAEWETMARREEVAQAATRLIYPVVFSDGKHFPDYAKKVQSRDLSKWNIPYPIFAGTQDYVVFHQQVSVVAQEIEDRLEHVPGWDPNWPIMRPGPAIAPPVAAVPRL